MRELSTVLGRRTFAMPISGSGSSEQGLIRPKSAEGFSIRYFIEISPFVEYQSNS
jgi:hypothetical protein